MREEILQQIIDDLPSIRVEFSLILGAISVLIVGLIRHENQTLAHALQISRQ